MNSITTGVLLFSSSVFSLVGSPESKVESSTSFPTTGLLPKTEIGALAFLEENPEADGRGVIVAVLDTGVDPGAPGMQKTTTGAPKIIAVIDATGSGDVVTETVVKPSKDGRLEGLSGRKLTISDEWENPTGEFRLGLVAGYNIFPDELIYRLRKERKEDWDAEQRQLERELQAAIDAFELEHTDPSATEKEQLENLKKQLEAAEAFASSYEDPGPVYDCVVFHDGNHWRAVVDTDTDGDLSNEKALANFDVEQEYATFGDESLLNFGINVYNDGDLLSIVADTGMHGTHVAGIVGAYFEDQPELNGVAPGAQIVSIKIGDTRLGGMETPHALSRAAIAIRKYNCDLVNMSYGEAIRFPTEGNLIEKLSSLVDDDNVVYVSSAGNSGPALTTVGAPGGTTTPIIGVGATITPALMKASYSLLKDLPTTQFTWSSRGPTIDGDLGVDISAPGGAIAPVPRWELSKNMRANGTSMASPDACGGLALVLSALKQSEKPYTAIWVKRAAMHAAKPIAGVDVFGQGQGMLQIGATYDILANLPEYLLETPRFEISIGSDHARGIYLRNGNLLEGKQTFSISVKPKFPEATDKEDEADFEARYNLATDADWVTCPDYAFVNSLSKRFNLQLDLSTLEPGVHYSEVVAIDSNHPEAGPTFRIPITVVVPTELDSNEWEKTETLEPGQITRYFFQVPAGATWASIEVESPESDESKLLVVHPQHTIPGERYVNVGGDYYLRVSKDKPGSRDFAVIEGSTMELALAQYWSELESGTFEIKMKFHGVNTELGDGVFAQGEKGEEFRVVSLVEPAQVSPKASLAKIERTIAAKSAVINVLNDDRDSIQKDGEAYHELVLDYAFSIDESTDVTAVFRMLNDKIYEIEFESQLQMFYDANKRLVATNDTFPDPVSLKKGDYTLRLQLRHTDKDALEAVKSINLTLLIDLQNPIQLGTYQVTDHALIDDSKFRSQTLEVNTRVPLVVAEPQADDLPKGLMEGDRLIGSLKLQSEAPVSTPLSWVYAGKAFKEAETEDSPELPEDSLEEKVSDSLLKLLAEYREEKDQESFDRILKKYLSNSPRPIEVALEKLRWQTGEDDASVTAIEKAAEAVLALIDQDEVAIYFGTNHELADAEAAALKKKMKTQRKALIEAYAAIASAHSERSDDVESLETHFENLKRWANEGDLDSSVQKAIYQGKGYQGELLVLLGKELKDDVTDKSSFESRLEIIKDLGWEHIVEYEKAWMLRRFPSVYAPF